MQHDEQTIRRLAKIQYDTFSAKRKLIWYGICILCILAGILGNLSDTARILLIGFGGIVIVNIGITGKFKADDTLQAIKTHGGTFPCTTLTFQENGITVQESGIDHCTSKLRYDSIVRLIEDDAYFYLFISNTAAYMLPKNAPSIKEQSQQEAWRTDLCRKTGLSFSRPFRLLRFNLKELLSCFHKTS